MSRLENNLQAWAKHHPKEAVLLQYFPVKESSGISLEQVEKWFSGIELAGCDLLYIYGAQEGLPFLAAKNWLAQDSKRQLILLEDDLCAIRSVFETEAGDKIVASPQAEIHFFESLEESERIFNRIFWKFPHLEIQVACSPCYQVEKQERFAELSHKLFYDAAMKKTNLKEYLSGGTLFFKNFYQNLLQLPKASTGQALFGKFQNVPAIICGAGPSLGKQLSLLGSLTKKALLFGGSSSLTALDAAGIRPHFGAGIDPNEGQLCRLKGISELTYPFLYRNRFCPDALKLVKGPRIYISGSGGYDVAGWFEEKLQIPTESIEEGQNVINFCLELAHLFGCNPIIFVGMDLAYTEDQYYAPGIFEENKFSLSSYKSSSPDNLPLQRNDIFGKPVWTHWKWVAESKWIADFAKENTHVKVINATEGGLGFAGVDNQTLKEVAKEHLRETYNFEIEKFIETGRLCKVSEKRVLEVAKELKESLISCVEHLRVLSEENGKMVKLMQEGNAPEITQSGLAALAEIELETESGWQAVLSIFNEVIAHLFLRDLENLAKIEDKREKTLKRLSLNQQKFSLLKEIAESNLGLLLPIF